MELLLPICETFTHFLSDGKTPYEKAVSEYHLTDQWTPFGAMVEYHPTSAKDMSRLQKFGPKVLPSTFLGYVLYAE